VSRPDGPSVRDLSTSGLLARSLRFAGESSSLSNADAAVCWVVRLMHYRVLRFVDADRSNAYEGPFKFFGLPCRSILWIAFQDIPKKLGSLGGATKARRARVRREVGDYHARHG
jgi:hypothetical protein